MDGVTVTMLSETLYVVGLTESVTSTFRFRKNPMNFCSCDIEEREHGVGEFFGVCVYYNG